MSLFDPAFDKWKPLQVEPVADQGSALTGNHASDEFQSLHASLDTADHAAVFMPLYENPDPPSQKTQEKEKPDGTSAEEKPEPDADTIRKMAYEAGFSEGETKGIAAGEEKIDGILQHMQNLLSEMQEMWKPLIAIHEQQIIQLICRATEKVVFGGIAVDQEAIKPTILCAFQMIPEPVEVTIEVNSEDAAYIDSAKADFFAHVKTLKHISVIPNPSITRGGCRVKTRFGEVDATVESRLDAIQQTLMNVCRMKTADDPTLSSGV
jgi:flagellar assembly protein FliH